MMRLALAASAAVLLASCAANGSYAVADNDAAIEPAAVASVSDAEGDPDEVICKKLKVTGSRLATRTQCRTRAEWNATFNAFRGVNDMKDAATANSGQ